MNNLQVMAVAINKSFCSVQTFDILSQISLNLQKNFQDLSNIQKPLEDQLMREEQRGISQQQTSLAASIPLISQQGTDLLYKFQVGKPLAKQPQM